MFKTLFIAISLLTCSPCKPLYSHYGHTALRVLDTESGYDIVYNYGLFSFEEDHFYWKFVKGETYYQLGCEPAYFAFKDYAEEGREVYEQWLNLTDEQARKVADMLEENYRPENRTYLYNFVFDNCATRPYRLLVKALGDSLSSTYTGWQGKPYRPFISHYTGRGSWADFGINMVFGARANQPMNVEQTLFLPEELMNYLQQARFADGTPVVKAGHVGKFVIQPVPWYKTWYAGAAVFAILMVVLSWWDRRRGRLSYGVDIALGVVYVLLIGLVVFLTFFSIHPLVGFNIRLLLFPMIHLCARLIYIIR